MTSSTPVDPVITLDALKIRLDGAVAADGHLDLTPDLLPFGDLATFVADAPNGRFRLLHPASTLSGGGGDRQLILTGDLVDWWTLPQVGGGQLSTITIRAQFTQAQPATPIQSRLTVTTARLTLAGTVYPVTGTLDPGGRWLRLAVAASDPTAGRPSLTALVTALIDPVAAARAPVGIVALNALSLTRGDLCFGFATGVGASTTLTAACDGDWTIIDGGLLALRQLGVRLCVVQGPSGGGSSLSSCSLGYHAVTDFCGQVVTVTLAPTVTDQWRLALSVADGATLPRLADIAGFIGGDALRNTVKTGIDLLGLGDVTVDAVSVDIDMARRSLATLLIRGRIGFAGTLLQASVQLPDFRFVATLPPATNGGTAAVISLDRAAAQCLGEAADLPTLTINALTLSAHPSSGSYGVSMATEQDWNWAVGGAGGPVLTLKNVEASLSRMPGATGGGLSVRASIGGVNLDLGADYLGVGAGWYFAGAASVPGGVDLGGVLQDIVRKLGGDVPSALITAIGSLSITSLSMMADTKTGSFQFSGDVALSGGLPLGDSSYTLRTRAVITSSVDATSKRRGYAGHLEADFTIGGAVFVLTYDFGPTPSVITGRWRDDGRGLVIGVADIMKALAIDAVLPAPSGLNLSLKTATFEYRAAQRLFTFSAESALFDDAFLTIAKDGQGKWGAVFGVDIPGTARLSDIPGIGKDFKAADSLTFKRMAVMLASTAFTSYTPPVLPPLPAPADTGPFPGRLTGGRATTPLAAGATLPLAVGLSLTATIDFAASGSGDAALKNLRGLVGTDELLMLATVGPAGVFLSATLSGSVGIPTGGGSKLTLSNPAVSLTMGPAPSYQISGRIAFAVFGTPVEATARLVMAPTQAQVAVSVSTATGSLPSPPGVKGLHLQQFGVLMGVFFEPPGLDFGIQGQFQVGETQALRGDQFALVLQVVGDVPNILYLSFYLDRLDFGQLITLFTDRSAPDLVQAMSIVKASQLSFRWCEAPVVLPDGSTALPGFAVSANIALLSLSGHVDLAVSTAQGISGAAEMTPVNLRGVLRIAGNGKGRTRTWQQRNGVWAEVANNAVVRQTPPLPTRQEIVVPPGGPVIAFNCLTSPFLQASWSMSLFDVVNQTVQVMIAASGFSFALTYNVAGIERFNLSCSLMDGLNFAASANCRIGVDATVGPIHVGGVSVGRLRVQAVVTARLDVSLTTAKFALLLGGTFAFMGLNVIVPSLLLSVAPASLAELPPQLVKQIADNADTLFQALFRDAGAWARMVAAGAVTEVANMGAVLSQAYKLAAADAANVLKGAGYAVGDVAAQLKQGYGLTANAMAAALKGAGYAATDAANVLKQSYSAAADVAASSLKTAGYAANDVARALNQSYGLAANATATVMKGLNYSANEVGGAVNAVYGNSADVATQALKAAGYTAEQTGDYVKSAFNLGSDALNSTLSKAGYATNDIKNYFNKLGGDFSKTFNKATEKLNPKKW